MNQECRAVIDVNDICADTEQYERIKGMMNQFMQFQWQSFKQNEFKASTPLPVVGLSASNHLNQGIKNNILKALYPDAWLANKQLNRTL